MSNAGSEDFGRFLDDNDSVNQEGSDRRLNLPQRPRTSRPRPRDARLRHRGLHLPVPPPDVPFRISTRRPINLRLAPPPDTSELPDENDNDTPRHPPQFFSQPAFRQTTSRHQSQTQAPRRNQQQTSSSQPQFRVFTREEVRGLTIPRPPSSQLSSRSTNATDQRNSNATNNFLQWRLRGLLGDNASVTSIRAPEATAESDRFTLGSYKTSAAGSVDGTTAELRRALDSRFIRTSGNKRARDNVGNARVLQNLDEEKIEEVPEKIERGDGNDGLNDRQRHDPPQRENASGPDNLTGDGSEGNLGVNYDDEDYGGGDGGGDEESLSSAKSSRPPSRLSSENASANPGEEEEGNLFVQRDNDENGIQATTANRENASNENGSQEEADEANIIRPRPRDPHEVEAPLIFEVPVTEMPNIDWGAEDIDIDGEYLQQQLEHSESESEEESDAGSVAEMIDDDSDDDPGYSEGEDGNKEWVPPQGIAEELRGAISSDSDSDDDPDRVEALTDSEDDENAAIDSDAEVSEKVVSARRSRPKRNRIPTVKWWLGERVEYETSGKHQLMTAVDVRRVEVPRKTYRKRRPYRRRRPYPSLQADDMEAEAVQQDVQVPVFDTASREWRDRTVARSIAGLDFVPVEAEDGSRLPLITRCILFGGKSDSAPLRLSVLRVEPGGMFSSTAEQNKASTFVVWRGKCTVHLNNHEFDLMKGMACLVPRGNDFFVDNGSTDRLSTGDVYLFVTEINADSNPDLADAMARDAQSMISGAAAFSNFFESDRSSEPVDANDDAPSPRRRTDPNEVQAERGIEQQQQEEHDSFDDQLYDGIDNDDDGVDDVVNEAGLQRDGSDQTDTFVPGFARALRSNSETSQTRPTTSTRTRYTSRPAPESVDSLSFALGSDRARQLDLQQRSLPRSTRPSEPQNRPIQEDTDDLDMLSDYLEGRKGNSGRRIVLRERPIVDANEFRIRSLLRQSRQNRSDFSYDSQ